MRHAWVASLVLGAALTGSPVFAQRTTSTGRIGVHPSPSGISGNILHPGTAPNSGMRAPGLAATSVPRGFINGNQVTGPRSNVGGLNRGSGRRSGFGYGGPVYVPYPIYGSGFTTVYNPAPGAYDPIFGGYNPGIQPDYSQQGYDQSGYDQQGPSPTVIINQNFQPEVVRPQIIDYSHVQFPPQGTVHVPPQPAEPPVPASAPAAGGLGPNGPGDTPLLLIAMKDHTIYPALAYWIDGDTLNYVAVGGTVNHASLSAIDRELSLQLNSERRADFKLPPAK